MKKETKKWLLTYFVLIISVILLGCWAITLGYDKNFVMLVGVIVWIWLYDRYLLNSNKSKRRKK